MSRKLIKSVLATTLVSALFMVIGVNSVHAEACTGSRAICNPLIISTDPSNPLSQVNYVDVNNGAVLVPMLVFNIRSNASSSIPTLNQLTISTFSSSTSPTGYHLFHGSQELSYRPASTTVTFSNIFDGATTTPYYIKADFPATTPNGTATWLNLISVIAMSNGGLTQNSSGISSNTQYFYHATPNLNFTSASAVANNNPSGTTISASATFNFTATPYPGTGAAYATSGKDFVLKAVGGPNGKSITLSTKSLVYNNVTPTNNTLSPGQLYSMSLSGIITVAGNLSSGIYTFYITSASSTTSDAAGVNVPIIQTFGLDNWHTNPITITAGKSDSSPSRDNILPTNSKSILKAVLSIVQANPTYYQDASVLDSLRSLFGQLKVLNGQ